MSIIPNGATINKLVVNGSEMNKRYANNVLVFSGIPTPLYWVDASKQAVAGTSTVANLGSAGGNISVGTTTVGTNSKGMKTWLATNSSETFNLSNTYTVIWCYTYKATGAYNWFLTRRTNMHLALIGSDYKFAQMWLGSSLTFKEQTDSTRSWGDNKIFAIRQNGGTTVRTYPRNSATSYLDNAGGSSSYVITAVEGGAGNSTTMLQEFLVYDRALTDSELQKVYDYLGAKWR